MALATKCPQCGALFRVVADQLKLRGGLVRCGQCRAVFDAIGSLTYVDDTALAQTRTITALTQPLAKPAATRASGSEPAAPRRRPRPAPNTEPGKQTLGPATTLRIAPMAPATLANASLRRSAPLPGVSSERKERSEASGNSARRAAHAKRERAFQEQAEAVLGVPTLIAPGGRERVDASSIVDGIEVIELAALPRETEASQGSAVRAVPVEEEPEFIRANRPSPSSGRRGFSIVFTGGSVVLAALVALQLAVIYRAELMAGAPQTRGALMQLCAVFGCTVGWPTRVGQLAVIGSELQTIPGTDVLELTAVIRNRADFRQALPAVEVTLTDSLNRPIARKVFTPADYLAAAGEPSSRIEDGLGSGSDYTIRLFFEARGVQAAGFLVYPFFI
ncbi:MAG TPA: zinc-ribbon and DUF3426 domain-containing protein [Burkholderiaceae bacterium]|nr:zinc-ribbon and DUF3426 domain-containing protein [Burkholderiaceae bacterium]